MAVINAAGALVVAGISQNLNEAVELAKETLSNGKALRKMEQLKMYTQKF